MRVAAATEAIAEPRRSVPWGAWATRRWPALVMGAIGLPVAVVATLGSLAWPGQQFPGFFVMSNGLVPAIGLYSWSGWQAHVPLLWQVVEVDGAPVHGSADVYRVAAARPDGSPTTYVFSRGNERAERSVPTMRFETRDYWSTIGAFIICGWSALGLGVAVGLLRPDTWAARAFLVQGSVTGLYGLTGSALYSPGLWWMTPLHLLVQAVLPASFIHLGLSFPIPRRVVERHRAVLLVPYAASLALLAWFVAGFYGTPPDPRPFIAIFLYVGIAIPIFVGVPIYAYWENRAPRVRQQLNTVIPGVVLATAVALWAHLHAVVHEADFPANLMALTVPLFYASVAHAIVRHDLFDIDTLVKQAAVYGTLTVGITAAYSASLAGASALAPAFMARSAGLFHVIFVVLVGIMFEPVRRQLQTTVDRLFFRRRLDYRVTVRELSKALTSVLDLDEILGRVAETVSSGFQVGSFTTVLWTDESTRMHVTDADGRSTEAVGPPSHSALRTRLERAAGQPWIRGDARDGSDAETEADALGAQLLLPLAIGGRVIGAMLLGPRRSGRPFSQEDLELLGTLAAQSAIAIENAHSYRALAELNRELEGKVLQRTAQLEASYTELKGAQARLVQSEKMASLGVLVAGVAHEINNPVSFIVNTMEPLREMIARLGSLAPTPPDAAFAELITDITEAVDVVTTGAERTAGIVRDLRVFSRLGDSAVNPIDVPQSLDMTLRLLHARLGDGVTVTKDYGATPPVESAPGQLNQVFMNVLANACDAVGEHGHVWITTRSDDHRVTITIRDDGRGIAPDDLRKVFDPFFTTKPPGKGTGLGLAISHGIVARHGGTIDVQSERDVGTTVTIAIPVRQPRPTIES